jgi:hypothetical protein
MSADTRKDRIREKSRRYYEKNREKVIAASKRYYEENRDTVRARQGDYRKTNREEINATERRYYGKNRDTILEKLKAYRETDRDKVGASKRRYYGKNRDTILEKNRLRGKCYRQENREALRAKGRKHYTDNRDAYLVKKRAALQVPANRMRRLWSAARIRAIRKGLDCSTDLREMLTAAPPANCTCCGCTLDYSTGRGHDKDHSPSLDRIDNGKGYTVENVAVICMRCNWVKGDASLAELEMIANYMRRHAESDAAPNRDACFV